MTANGNKDSRREWKVEVVFFIVLALLVFRAILPVGTYLMTTDDNVGDMAARKAQFPAGFLGGWRDNMLVGEPQVLDLNWTNLLLWLSPLELFVDWLHAIDLGLAALFLMLFFKKRGLSLLPRLVGAVAAFWVGTNLTLTFAGHIGKYGVLLFASAYLWLVEEAVSRKSPWWAVLAGGAMGGMFLEQPDVAFFFAMFLGPYALFAVWREYGWDKALFLRLLAPLLVVVALVMFRPIWTGYQTSIAGVASVEQDSGEKWDFITQWSWPPEESIDFVAPGFMGWRSNEPSGPYWGRMGRSAGWKETGQGFQNFKLENQYLGAVAVLLALWALWLAIWLREPGHRVRRDLICWGAITIVALLLSLGKFFPLYRVLYMFPLVSSIRNPNKFLHVFQIGMGILAAFGLDALVGKTRDNTLSVVGSRRIKQFRNFLIVLTGVLGIWFLGSFSSAAATSQRLAVEGWPNELAHVIADNQWKALGIAVFMCAVVTVVFALLTGKKWAEQQERLRKGAWALLALAVIDVLILSGQYVHTLDSGLLEGNEVVQALKSVRGDNRVAMVMQSGFYNNWLTYLFPYHDIDAVNVTQMPRMPIDYKRFLGSVGNVPKRFWRLCAARFVLAPAQAWAQIQQDPGMKDDFGIVYAYNTTPRGPLSVNVTAGTQEKPGSHVIMQLVPSAPRYALFRGWRTVGDDEALALLRSDTFPLFETLLVSPDTAQDLPESDAKGLTGTIAVKGYRPGRVHLQTTSEYATILRLSDHYTPGCQVTVDGEEVPMLRCDFLFQGVYLQEGLHDVIVQYKPGRGPFLIQVLGMLACLGSIGVLVVKSQLTSAVSSAATSETSE